MKRLIAELALGGIIAAPASAAEIRAYGFG
jgi:hypothetical protein